jgi:hypothetical protein
MSMSKYPFDDGAHELPSPRKVPGIIAKPSPLTPLGESQRRKAQPLFQGFLMYFPDACLAIAEHSRKANDKHNPGEPLHWSKDKSKDHADCIARHLIDIGPDWDAVDPEFESLHATALAWRSMALLQTVLERRRTARAAPPSRPHPLDASAPAPVAPPPPTPFPAKDSGWRPWGGGDKAPVDDLVRVHVKLRDGTVVSGQADAFTWKHGDFRMPPSQEIVEYKAPTDAV